MRAGERVFVDSGAWIALALVRDPLYGRALEAWSSLQEARARLYTSLPVVLETFTFLDRNTRRDVALAWKASLNTVAGLTMLEPKAVEIERAFEYFQRADLHKLSAVDATSFVLMKREKIRVAFSYDHHFTAVGFRLVG
jgi:predicted nucleic acid-binding protein